MTLDMSN